MNLPESTPAESRLIGEALRAAADGPFFPDWEFSLLFGLERSEVRRIADAWPTPIVAPDVASRAVNNSFNNLLGYPHRRDDAWATWISVDRATFEEFFLQWRRRRGENGVRPTR